MKTIYLAVAILLLALFAVFAADYFLPKQGNVCFRNNCFTVEIAATGEQRERGLMFREHLDKDKGMLFVFDSEGDYPFWMKNTKIPLDMIWMNQNKYVVYIGKNTQPCINDPCQSINPGKNALYVLEVNAGTADALGLKEGDKFIF
jgi:uncharacterized membrane protein (UPF0127 family)